MPTFILLAMTFSLTSAVEFNTEVFSAVEEIHGDVFRTENNTSQMECGAL